MNSRQAFVELLDKRIPAKGPGTILVLRRNDDPYDMAARVEHAFQLVKEGIGDTIIIPVGTNTAEEADWALAQYSIADDPWKRIILVTSREHHYRAFLTFLKQFQYIPIEVSPADYHGLGYDREMERIERYKDDVASFEEGIRYLNAHNY